MLYNYICSDIYFYNIFSYNFSDLGNHINTKDLHSLCISTSFHHPTCVVWGLQLSLQSDPKKKSFLLSNESLMIC